MPLPLRKVEPVYVSRGNLPDKFKIPNDLEACANGTLSNVILQLSSLSHHASEIFTDLVRVASEITTRSANLQSRLDRISVKVQQIDGTHEEYSMQDCLNTKPFQSSTNFDQQVVSRNTMSKGMLKTHLSCDKPPPLEKLNVYRDDGKDGLKFYTDPNYFFDLWRKEMLKDTERAVKKPHKPKSDGRQHKKRVRQPHNTREKQKTIAIQKGEVIMDAQTSKPIEVVTEADMYPPPEMSKKSNSRPVSMEFKQVSFDLIDDIDGDDDEEKKVAVSVPEQRLDDLLNQTHNYYPPAYNSANSYNAFTKDNLNNAIKLNNTKNDQNQNEISSTLIRQGNHVSHSQYVNDSPRNNIGNLRQVQNSYNSSNSNSSNALSLSTANRQQQQQNDVIPGMMRLSSGSTSTIASSRRRSSASSENSLKMFVSRPNVPPPPPPPPPGQSPNTNSNSVYQVTLSGTPLSKAGTPTDRTANNGTRMMATTTLVRESLPPPPPPPESDNNYEGHDDDIGNNDENDDGMPPPMNDEDLPPPPPLPMEPKSLANMKAPSLPEEMLPPSPPPPPPLELEDDSNIVQQKNVPIPPAPPPVPAMTSAVNGLVITKEKKVVEVVVDTRSELLKAIRGGINLKKVDEKKEKHGKDDKTSTLHDVASILARRVAVEMSDSDSDSVSEDSDCWDETSA